MNEMFLYNANYFNLYYYILIFIMIIIHQHKILIDVTIIIVIIIIIIIVVVVARIWTTPHQDSWPPCRYWFCILSDFTRNLILVW